ncbi:hypothetical protein RZS08_11810, partial [Arthrospira platensis SPKY1]|nr:hypothetical protein [Arthrospira platensis SPKY1]
MWLFWGHGNPTLPPPANVPLTYFATSNWRPNPLLTSINMDPRELSYTARWQQTHFTFTTPRYIVRTTHHSYGITMSSGVMRHIPAAFQLDDSLFGVAWAGTAQNRLIEA